MSAPQKGLTTPLKVAPTDSIITAPWLFSSRHIQYCLYNLSPPNQNIKSIKVETLQILFVAMSLRYMYLAHRVFNKCLMNGWTNEWVSGCLGGQVSKSRLGTDCGSCWKKARVLQTLAFHFREYGLCTVPKCPRAGGRGQAGKAGGTKERYPRKAGLHPQLTWNQFMRRLLMQTHGCSLHMRHQEISQECIHIRSIKGTPLEGKRTEGVLDNQVSFVVFGAAIAKQGINVMLNIQPS